MFTKYLGRIHPRNDRQQARSQVLLPVQSRMAFGDEWAPSVDLSIVNEK